MPMAMRIIGAKRGVLQLAWSSSEAGGMPPARTESARMSDCAEPWLGLYPSFVSQIHNF